MTIPVHFSLSELAKGREGIGQVNTESDATECEGSRVLLRSLDPKDFVK